MNSGLSQVQQEAPKESLKKRYFIDSLLALGSIFALTEIIFLLHLYQRIPDSLLSYVLVIVVLASLRGPYAALLASFVAFFSFDFLYLPPAYSFLVSKFEDVLGLIVFLVTAITIGQLASALRRRAEEADKREREMHVLYDMVRATHREKSMEALLTSVSHDLRTPLSTIKAAATSLLQEELPFDAEEKRRFLSAIEREADRLNQLVENLLDMSRIEGGALTPHKVWYLLDELLHSVLEQMQPLLEGREVQTHLPDNLPPIEIDYIQIGQVLTNILENALRYTPAGSPISISVQWQAEQVLLSVADRGPGVPRAERERIFDKFYRVHSNPDAADHARGSGLGLAVSRGLVEAHSGQLWVEERPGGGAIFCFTLPHSPLEKEEQHEEGKSTHSRH